MKYLVITFFVLSVFVANGFCAEPDNSIIAWVNTVSLTAGKLRQRVEPALMPYMLERTQMRSDGKWTTLREQTFQKKYQDTAQEKFTQLVIEALLVQEAERRDIVIPESEVDIEMKKLMDSSGGYEALEKKLEKEGASLFDLRSTLRQQRIVNTLRSQLRTIVDQPTPIEIRNFYNKNLKKFNREEEMVVRQIMLRTTSVDEQGNVTTRADADELAIELRNRACDGELFSFLAHEYSDDRATAKRGGLLHGNDGPKFTRSACPYTEPLRTVIFSVEEGKVSQPVEYNSTIYLFYAERHQLAGVAPMYKVQRFITNVLSEQKINERQKVLVEELVRKSIILDGERRRFEADYFLKSMGK